MLHTYVIQYSPPNDPNNGMINCSLGDDGIPSYEDTCSFTCNNGYELTGSNTRTCQSDGSWSGSDNLCRRSNSYVACSYTYLRKNQLCMLAQKLKLILFPQFIP